MSAKPEYFHHTIEYPDGTIWKGKVDRRPEPEDMGLRAGDICGARVLDIAANDGFFSFWAEQYKAAEVLAIDVETYDGYDWGFRGPPAVVNEALRRNMAAGFWFHHNNLKSKVRREKLSVYDLDPAQHGSFDFIFNFGLLYHLRHPILALEKCRAVCGGVMALETHILETSLDAPLAVFSANARDPARLTDWFLPTRACVAACVYNAGFDHVFIEKKPRFIKRRRFLCAVRGPWLEWAHANSRFKYCDDDYWRKMSDGFKVW